MGPSPSHVTAWSWQRPLLLLLLGCLQDSLLLHPPVHLLSGWRKRGTLCLDAGAGAM